MDPNATTYRLTTRQSAQLALSVLVVYYPILLFVNLPVRTWSFFIQSLPFLMVRCAITAVLYFTWIVLTEVILEKTAKRFGEEFLVEAKLPFQLLALAITLVAGLGLNRGFDFMQHKLTHGIPRPAVMVSRNPGDGPQPPGPPRHEPTLNPARWDFFERSNNGLTIVIMLSIFYLAANRRANRRLKDVQVQAEQLEKETVLAQFAALKNQVSPHFLFNSLSILSSLVQVDPDLSEQFIDQLSRAYRYILEQKDNDRVALKTELTFIKSYIFLLKIRFEDSFDVQIDVPEADEDHYSIAPLTLQLLVENAVKHNRMSPEMPLTVYIEGRGDGLTVRNRLQPREQLEHSTGTGLSNIINRYRLLTDRPVRVGEEEGEFVVKIPLLS